MSRYSLLGSLATVALLACSASAQGVVEKAQEAQRFLDAGDAVSALESLDEAVSIAWKAAPLTVPTALFVESIGGYGLYVERDTGSVFSSGEKAIIYAELIGYGYGNSGTGSLMIGFDVDVSLKSAEGKQIFAGEKVTSVSSPVRYKNKEFFLDLDMSLGRLPPGDYVMELVLHDQNSEKSAPVTLNFAISD